MLLEAFVVTVFALFLTVVIREKLKNEAAKKAEIMRLVAQASQEVAVIEAQGQANRVEFVDYNDVFLVAETNNNINNNNNSDIYYCAVCYCPTTTRCARCKAVRYCSSKCQIIHWRQGHKNDCHPPTASVHLKERKDFSGNAASVMQSTSHEDAMASTCTTDVSADEVAGMTINGKSGTQVSDNVIPDMLGNVASGDKSVSGKLPESSDLARSVHGSCIKRKANSKSNCTDEEINLELQSLKRKNGMPEDVQPRTAGNVKLSKGSAASDKLVRHKEKTPQPRLECVDSYEEDDSRRRKCKEVKSLLPEAPGGFHPTVGKNLIPSSNPSECNGYRALPTKISSASGLQQNAGNSLKTSVQKFVQQFRVPKESKSNLLGHRKELAGNYKMAFPYDLFVKLYTCDRLQLFPFGLMNCGNSCYANAVLQCLAFTRPLTSYLLRGLHSKACRKKGWCFLCEFESLILKGKEGSSPLPPIGILSKIHKIGGHLSHGREEDAHEFLRYAVDTMQSVCLKEAGVAGRIAEETTLVGLTFGGYLRSKIKCMKCHGKSEQSEKMMDLTVEIDGDIGTLEEALAQFTATEVLDAENKYHCSRCKSYEKAKKKLSVLEAPNILTIVLKRFQSGSFEKLNKSVRFPEVLNLAPYMSGVSDTPTYRLYAVVVHLDVSNDVFSGHYVCYVKDFQGEWFRIDDSTVIPVELDRVLVEGAYMLLYSRNSPRPPASVRNGMVAYGDKLKKRNLEAVPSSNLAKPKVVVSGTNPAVQQQKPLKYSYWTNGPAGHQSSHPNDRRYQSMQRIPKVDSWSESSSLFSSSDASSCGTVSTKDSTSSEDLSQYIFGEAGPSSYSRYGSSLVEDDRHINNAPYAAEDDIWRRLSWDGQQTAFLHTNTGRHRRNSTSTCL